MPHPQLPSHFCSGKHTPDLTKPVQCTVMIHHYESYRVSAARRSSLAGTRLQDRSTAIPIFCTTCLLLSQI